MIAPNLQLRRSILGTPLLFCLVGAVACGAAETAPTGSGGTTASGGTANGSSGTSGGGQANGNAGTSAGGTANNAGTNPGGASNGGSSGEGAGGASGGAGGQGAGGQGVATSFMNYELSGSFPTLAAAIPTAAGQLTYTRITVHEQFLAESCSIADYNGDGNPDVSSGRRWYEGPAFTTEHIFRDGHGPLPRIGMPREEIDTGVSDDWADFPWDVDGDGDPDIINVSNCDVQDNLNPDPQPINQSHATAFVYQNPGGAAAGDGTNWPKWQLHGDVRHEQKGLVDINGDGKPEMFGACKGCEPNNTKGYYFNDWTNPNGGWSYQPVVFNVDFPFGGTGWMHGLGFGDVDGDGKPDLLTREGAYIQPADVTMPWPLTAVQLWDGDPAPQRGGSHMYSADFDGDGDMDIFSADGAHHWGLSWYENTGNMQFTKHQFMGTVAEAGNYPNNGGVAFSEPHATQVTDMDGDGVPDVIAGKMRFAHPIAENDPDALGTCAQGDQGCAYDAQGRCTGPGDSCNYLVVFKGVRDTPGTSGAFHFEAHVVDTQTGVGRQFSVGHANTDGIVDICVASKLGLFVFVGQ